MIPHDITVIRDSSGNAYLEGIWPDYSLVYIDFIRNIDKNIAWITKERVFFRLSNSEAVYKRLGPKSDNPNMELIQLERLEI